MGKKSLKDKEERRRIGRMGGKNLSKREELGKIDNIWEKGEELKKVWIALKQRKKTVRKEKQRAKKMNWRKNEEIEERLKY